MSFYPAAVLRQWQAQTNVPGILSNGLTAIDLYWSDSQAVAADTDGIMPASQVNVSFPLVVDSGLTDPPCPRNVTATAGGTAGDIAAVQVVVEGTNYLDESISETLPAFTANTAGSVTGAKAFKTITQITVPEMDGTGATVSIGFGDKLGLPYLLTKDMTIGAWKNNVREGTLPTVAVSGSDIESNTIDLSSALDGTAVVVALLLPS